MQDWGDKNRGPHLTGWSENLRGGGGHGRDQLFWQQLLGFKRLGTSPIVDQFPQVSCPLLLAVWNCLVSVGCNSATPITSSQS